MKYLPKPCDYCISTSTICQKDTESHSYVNFESYPSKFITHISSFLFLRFLLIICNIWFVIELIWRASTSVFLVTACQENYDNKCLVLSCPYPTTNKDNTIHAKTTPKNILLTWNISISKNWRKINKRNISVLISRPLSNVKYKMEERWTHKES